MKIQSVGVIHSAQTLHGPHRAAGPQSSPATSTLAEADQLDISSVADIASRELDTQSFRADRVAQLRAAIEAGNYETDEKIGLALDRMLDEIA